MHRPPSCIGVVVDRGCSSIGIIKCCGVGGVIGL